MSVLNITDQDFATTIPKMDKAIVKYFADWCGSCKLISPKFRRLSDDEQFGDVDFLEINAEINEAARKAANVDNLPFFAIFKNGEMIQGSATSKIEKVEELLNKLK